MASSASSYHDNNPLTWDYYDPEYAVIPWSAHGQGRLTIKLALWCLAMMAANGDGYLDYSYPGLDSWRRAEKGFVHNTSGNQKTELSRHDRYQEPDPQAAAGEAAAPEGGGGAYYGYSMQSQVGDDDPHFFSPASQGGGDDVPQFSQASSAAFGGGPVQEHQDEEEDDGDDNDDDDDDDDDQTEVGATRKRVSVKVKKHTLSRKLYFVDAKGNEKNTSKKKWRQVPDGYELDGRRHVYFTKQLP